MACDQIEYCGNCKYYLKCRAPAVKGRLNKCRADGSKKKGSK